MAETTAMKKMFNTKSQKLMNKYEMKDIVTSFLFLSFIDNFHFKSWK